MFPKKNFKMKKTEIHKYVDCQSFDDFSCEIFIFLISHLILNFSKSSFCHCKI